ncbi:MAG TPA: hypothetical protein VGH38_10195 [Bryobacteraceae bacterium]
MNVAYRLAPGLMYRKSPPEQDAAFLRFVRSHPCSVCGTWRGVEACHTGPRGLSTRSDDRSAIPLCRRHHRTNSDSLHALGPLKFEERHRVSIRAIQAELNREYDGLLSRRKGLR